MVVDPGESNKIIELIDNNKINLRGVLITHHHYDHTNGLLDLIKKKDLEVYGPNNNIQEINNRVIELDKFTIIGIELFAMISHKIPCFC